MIARPGFAIVAILLLLTGLAGCKVDSIHPISTLDGTLPDAAIYGVWRYKAKGELTYLHIGPEFSLGSAAANKRTRIVIVDHKPNGITDEAYVAYSSRIGKQRYMNVVQSEDGKTTGFILVRYVLIDKNTIRFSTISEDALKAAIGAGRIKGTIRGEGLASQTAITAEPAEIQDFLRNGGEKLFGTPIVLTRVQDR
jgi:hypothetical protein